MALAERILTAILAAFAAWTVAYHGVVFFRWPAYAIGLLWLPLLAACWAGLRWLRRREKTSLESEPAQCRWLLPVCLLGLAAAGYTLVLNRPDCDDVAYFRRAVFQALNLRQPIFLTNLTYAVAVPDVVYTQYVASYEILIGMMARALHLDPLNLYFNVFAALAACCVPVVYYLLARRLELSDKQAAAVAAGAVVFLVLDGNRHWSPGNFAFARLWQGKCILVTLGVPCTLLLAWQFLRRPTWKAWTSVVLATICCAGLSATALFLVPAFLLAIAAAYVLAGGSPDEGWPTRLRRAAALMSAAAYPLALSLVFSSGLVPVAQQVASAGAVRSWLEVLAKFGDRWTFAWYAMLLLVVPWLALGRREARAVVLLSLACVAMCFNPLTGPPLSRILNVVYFRLFYMFPLALAAGLAVAALVRRWAWPPKLGQALVAATLLVAAALFVLQAGKFTFSAGNTSTREDFIEWKPPLEPRFSAAAREFLRVAAARLDDRIVLAPWEIAVPAAISNPRARFAFTRVHYTVWSFQMAGQLEEGQSRSLAQWLVAQRDAPPHARHALEKLVHAGLTAVVIGPKADVDLVRSVLDKTGARWQQAGAAAGYTLLLRQPG